ncbi:MAG: response regulator [Deltaproteobacteria bacterium]|nr:response regulator [Deltaproteobacteria bacterium]
MTTGPLVLLIEDEAQVRRFLRSTLTSQGYRLVEAETAAEGIALTSSHNPDVVLLDLGLPDADGLEVCRRIREWSSTPIVVLSARDREAEKVVALDGGADDYLTKPFGAGELLARLRVALRHSARGQAEPIGSVFETGELRVDLAQRLVLRAGREVHLTPLEYKLLATMIRHAGKVITHRQLLHDVWGPTYAAQTHYLRIYMANLRQKLEVESAHPRFLLTEPGVGYRLRLEDP